MTQDALLYTLALTNTAGIGNINAKKLIRYCGSARAVFETKKTTLSKISGIGRKVIQSLNKKASLLAAEKELDFIESQKINTLFYKDKTYPIFLSQCFDAPVLLFTQGNIKLENQRLLSIVGTRNMTSYGRRFLEEFIPKIKRFNPIIVSGLAYGVDILSHKLAVENGLQTIAVLAHGLDRIYPAIHKKIAYEMCKNGGLITDFWSGTNPDRENFVKRNRIVAGLSMATLVVESAERGGSLITAEMANAYNRDVFALPGRIRDAYSRGCNKLIKTNKAAMLTDAKDISYILGWDEEKQKDKAIQKQLFVELVEPEQKIYDYLLKEGKQHLDLIALHCNTPIYQLASTLLNLELKGVVKPLPGKYFEAV
ncbi:MAG: DNA-protecting protein DprA [Flavobacteriales bacterium]|nr:MAG: DNA-protecting protein DprA [Flavobacteriales bacterium]